MSNKLNHNVPGYSSDPGPSGQDTPETSNDDNPEEQEVIPKPEVPFVSRFGMKHDKNSLQDVECLRATLFDLKTEPIEDRERRCQETNGIFFQQRRDPNERDALMDEQVGDLQPEESGDLIDEPIGDLQPEETNTEIKSDPIDEIKEDTSLLYMETEQLECLPEFYLKSTENSSNIDAFNPRENELENNNMLQQSRELEEELDKLSDNIPLVALPVLPVPPEPEETDVVNPKENESENNKMLQQRKEPEEELDKLSDNIPLVVLPGLPVPPDKMNETNMQLVVPEAILNTKTETKGVSIDTTTNPRASDLDNGNTNIIENPESVQRKTPKRKDVIPTPTRVSTRIKKPRIKYNI